MRTHSLIIRLVMLSLLSLCATIGNTEGAGKMIPVGEPFVDFELEAHDGTHGVACRSRGPPVPSFLLPEGQYPRLNARSQPAAGQLERAPGTRDRGFRRFLRQPGKEPEVRRRKRAAVPPAQRPRPRAGEIGRRRAGSDPVGKADLISRGTGRQGPGGLPGRRSEDACGGGVDRLPRTDCESRLRSQHT